MGAQICTSVNGQPLDNACFEPIFDAIVQLDVPILLHPTRSLHTPDYPAEPVSQYDLWRAIGWHYETTLAMARLALAGAFERWPTLKIVAHHAGG